MRSAKRTLMIVQLLASGVAFLSWSQDWFTLTVRADNGQTTDLVVGGGTASPALAALGLAGLALLAAMAIAGPAIRFVLGALGIVLGGSIIWGASGAIADPAAAGTGKIGSATGVAGTGSVHQLVLGSTMTGWPVAAVAAGVLTLVVGVGVLVTGPRWPRTGRRYQPVVFESASGDRSGDPSTLFDETDDQDATPESEGGGDARDRPSPREQAESDRAAAAASGRPADAAVEDWDRLSAGQDPTSR